MENFSLNCSAIKAQKTKKGEPRQYYCLPIYKACIDLIRQIYSSTQKAPNHVRFGLVNDSIKELIQVIHKIRIVSNSSDMVNKCSLLEEIVYILEEVQILIRALYEIRAISQKGFVIVSSKSEDCIRQAQGWLKSQQN